MAGYLVANITVTDPAGFASYRDAVPAVLAQYGGRYLVRSGTVTAAESDLGFDRLVVIEFESVDAAKRFYHSAEYAPLLRQRIAATTSQVAFVEGIAEAS